MPMSFYGPVPKLQVWGSDFYGSLHAHSGLSCHHARERVCLIPQSRADVSWEQGRITAAVKMCLTVIFITKIASTIFFTICLLFDKGRSCYCDSGCSFPSCCQAFSLTFILTQTMRLDPSKEYDPAAVWMYIMLLTSSKTGNKTFIFATYYPPVVNTMKFFESCGGAKLYFSFDYGLSL